MQGLLRVLIVEEDEDDALLIERALRQGGYEPDARRVATADQMRAALRDRKWDVVVSDYVLPCLGVRAALDLLQEAGQDIPFIMCSAKMGEEKAVEVMKAGARDYVAKENVARLAAVVRRELAEAKVRTMERQAESARREAEARYRRLVEQMPAITYTCEVREPRTVSYVSPQVASILGYSDAEFAVDSKLLRERLHPGDRERVLEAFETLRANGEPVVCEYRLLDRAGQVVWVRDEAKLVTGEDGEPQSVQGVILDITEQRAAQDLRQLTNDLLELFVRKNSRLEYLGSVVKSIRDWCGCQCVGVRVLDEETQRIPYNAHQGFPEDLWLKENDLIVDSACACARVLTGKTGPQDEALLTERGSFVCPNAAEWIETLDEEARSRFRGECVRHGMRTVVIVPLRYRGRPIGAVHIADKYAYGVSARKVEHLESVAPLIGEAIYRFNMEEKLAESNALLERIFGNTHILIAYLDPDLNFIRVNRAYAEAIEESEDHFVGKNHFDLFPHEENEAIFREVIRTGQPYSVEAKPFVYPGGGEDDTTYWDWSIQPVLDEAGRTEGLVLCLLNVTERQRAQERVVEYQEQLRALAQQLSLAEQRERRQIAQSLHDNIGQALAVAKMKLRGLERSASDGQAAPLREAVELVQQSLSYTRTLLFDLSPPNLFDYGLEAALEQLSENFASEYNIDIRFDDDKQPKPLEEDLKVVLFQATRELLLNVIRHAEAQHVTLSVARVGDAVRVCVEDDGRGFAIPESGFRMRGDAGVGLFSICERLDHLKGGFQIQSRPGQGTVAVLTAPLKKEEGEPDGDSNRVGRRS